MKKPYYERDLSDFPDEVIVKVRQSADARFPDLWYATLNRPRNTRGLAMPDFATAARGRDAAIAKCAKVIRDDAQGIGKYAPHSCFRGYDLHWILCPHWAREMGEQVDDSV